MNVIALAFWLVQGWGGLSVHGIVRRADTDQPIAGALVEVVGTDRQTWTNAGGAYAMAHLACASCRLRFSAPLSDTAVVEVSAGPDSAVRIDVSLSPQPGRLPEIAVIAPMRSTDGSTVAGDITLEPAAAGARRYTTADIDAGAIGGHPDPLRILASAPDVASLPDIGTSLHVRGGGGDQNRVLLDGIPIQSPYHASGVLSALSPDFVDAVTIETGVPSARYGNALSSTIAVDTRRPSSATVAHGGVDALEVRQSLAGPLPGGLGGFVVAARQSARSLAFGHFDQAASGGFADAAAKVTIGLPLGSLEFLGFGTRDGLGFDGRVSLDTGAVGESAAGPGGAPSLARNAFSWSSATEAVVWSVAPTGGLGVAVRAWHSAADARIGWTASSGPIRLLSGLQDVGAAGEATWNTGWGEVSTGATIDRLNTRYRVAPAIATSRPASGSIGPYLQLQAAPLLAAAFLEGRWHVGPRLSLITGVREEIGSGLASTLEPRVSVRYALASGLTLVAGYARTQQSVQSLRNEESILDAVTGVGLPVAAGATGVPLARADQLTGALEQRLSDRTTVTLDGYVRRMDGLLAVPVVTAQPFALDRLARGSGGASGLALQFRYHGDRLGIQAGYGLNAAARYVAGQHYVPSFDARHTAVAALGYRLASGTTLRASVWAASERPTSLIGDAFEWTPFAPAGGAGELAGSPQHVIGLVNGGRVPPYVRLDLGVAHMWRPTVFGRVAQLTGRVGVTNVLNHANIMGILLAPGTTAVQRLPLLPRSLFFGIDWAY
jgi:carboxypeptidase family protein/TonB-dependent receptor-like protein